MAYPESVLFMRKLEGKVAIVTGGASGIGEATASHFADHGARAVVIADVQDEKGRMVVESIGTQRCSYVRCDVSDEEQVKAMVDWTIQKYGQLDIMFSNAGIISKSKQTILDLDFSQFDRLIQVNLRGMAACIKHAARVMVEKRVRGTIVCTASVVATRGAMQRTDYAMSKHGVIGLVRSASGQLGEYGIRVNSVSPSAIATPLTCEAYQTTMKDLEKIYENSFVPLTSLKGIVLTLKHVADAVLFLASDDSTFMTGHDLVVDGGLNGLPVQTETKEIR
ncbi:Short-chain dehydrogenase reductase 3b [Forsythia ovata]|uniref:Short-chain dehydrogenase reductase 3b n=1 Tax=Forsythia ovata TaxID=205694 RepID=A0ABD1PG79_9LAMI